MSKYDPLYEFLRRQSGDHVVFSFHELERLLDFDLPPSANEYPAWWANEESEATRHVHAKAWMDAGWKVTPNLESKTVEFFRSV